MTKKKLYDYYIMPRKTHKRQRKQNGGYGLNYLSDRTKKLQELANNLHDKHFKIIDDDLKKLHITAEDFEKYKKGSIFGFFGKPTTDTILRELTDYIIALSQIIFGDSGPKRIIDHQRFPSTTQVTQRGLQLPNWFLNFIDTYKLAILLYLKENPRESKENLVGITIDEFQEGDAQAGVSASPNEAPNPEDERLDAERLAKARQQILLNRLNRKKIPESVLGESVLGGRFVGKRKQKSNKHRRKSNRR